MNQIRFFALIAIFCGGKIMKKLGRFALFAIFTLVLVLSACLLVACNGGKKQVPVYKGMTISRSFARASAIAASDAENSDLHGEQGRVEGDYDKRDDDFDQNKPFEDPNVPSIENKANSTLDVVGAAESIYYAEKNQNIFITIKLSNPDSYEIMSFTLNGKKYPNYMFEDGSDMENLVLKVNVGNVGGIHDYTIDAIKYVDGTDIKDVRMDGDRTVKAGVRADDQTYVNVTNEQKTMTSISFDAQVVDLYSLIEKSGGYAKAVLYDGVNMLTKDIKVGEKTNIVFDNLTPNTVYQYGVVALYDNLSGNGAKLNTLYKKAVYTDTIVLFKDVQVGKESIEWGFVWNESFASKQMSAISLWQNGAKVQDVDTTATRLDGLKSNNEYALKATYNNLQNQDETIAIEFVTCAKAVPTVEIANVQSTQTAISFELNLTDTDNVGAIAKIELLHGENAPIVVENTDRTFANLLSNNDYTIKVTYTYDLNDGVGEQQIVKTADIKTKAKTTPIATISNLSNTQSTIECDVAYADVDDVGNIVEVALYRQNNKVKFVPFATHVAFDGLESGKEYKVVVEYKYDLNDGKGEQTERQTATRYTTPTFDFIEATCANTSAVSKGDIVYFEAKVNNPSGVVIDKIKINDKYYVPSIGTTKNSIIVNIAVEDQFEGGATNLEVTEIVGKLHEQQFVLTPVKNNNASIFVNGDIFVESIAIVDEEGYPCDVVEWYKTYYYKIGLRNKTGYRIDEIAYKNGIGYMSEISRSSSVIMDDDNTVRISCPPLFSRGTEKVRIESITYSNENIDRKTKWIKDISQSYVCVKDRTPIVISNVEQLKNIQPYHCYKLNNDIDLNGVDWMPISFDGIFDGQGYTIKNMNFVGTWDKPDAKWGLFSNANGIIKNLSVSGRFIATVTPEPKASSWTGSPGVVAGGVCSRSGILTLNNVVGDVNISITNCIIDDIHNNTYVGGLVGKSDDVLTITDSYARGNIAVKCKNWVSASGLVGIANNATIQNSYFDGDVTAESLNEYDIFGYKQTHSNALTLGGKVENCYYTAGESEYGGEKKTLEEIVAIFKDKWDSTVWDFDNLDENGNPTLKKTSV